MCHLAGIENIIVVLNNMDSNADYDFQDRFVECKNEIERRFDQIGYKTKKIAFIPIRAHKGDNIINKSDAECFKWYKGWTVKEKRYIIMDIQYLMH